MTEVREERCEAGCVAYHGGERRHHPDCVFYPESFTKLHEDLARAHTELQAQNARLQAALDAALAERLDRGEGLLDPGMPAAEIRLHMGEMSAQELRNVRAAIGWANAVARGTARAPKAGPAKHPGRITADDWVKAHMARSGCDRETAELALAEALNGWLVHDEELLLPDTPPPTHRHRKGGLYRLIARGRIEATLEPCAIYASVKDDLVWVRPEAEFEDGRFTRLVPEAELPALAPLPDRGAGA
jgi:hypothetical protein